MVGTLFEPEGEAGGLHWCSSWNVASNQSHSSEPIRIEVLQLGGQATPVWQVPALLALSPKLHQEAANRVGIHPLLPLGVLSAVELV